MNKSWRVVTLRAAIVLVLAASFYATKTFAAEEARFTAPGKNLRALVRRLLTEEFSRPDSTYELVPDPARHALTAWARIENSAPRYLFVLPGGGYCGATNCLILGFRKTASGWIRVYSQFGGDGIEVLDTSTNGHRDLRQWEGSAGEGMVVITSHWSGSAYGKPVIRRAR